MKNKKKDYQEPLLGVIKMRSLPCLNNPSPPAEGDNPDPADPIRNEMDES